MKVITIALILLLTACTPFLRPYDGTIGYKMSNENGVVLIEYINQKRISENRARKDIERACRLSLGEKKQTLNIAILSKENIVSSYDLRVPAPQYAESSGTFKHSNGSAIPRWSNANDFNQVKIDLVKYKATCSVHVKST